MTANATQTPSFVPRKRRGAELFLLGLALVIGIGAYCAVGLGVEGTIPADVIKLGGSMVVLAVATHLVVRRFAPYADPVLLPCVVMLNGLGLAMIYRIDLQRDSSLANQQLIWTLVGLIGFVATLMLIPDHRRLQALTYTFGLAAIVLLVLPLLPGIGQQINGARIWIKIGPMGFQPGELAKVCLVIFFSGYLVVNRDALALAGKRFAGIDFPRGRDLGPILVAWVLSLGVLVFQRDLGSSLLFFGLFLVMLYVATQRPGWLVVGGSIFVAGAYFAYLTFGHVQTRINGWLDPFSDDSFYQIQQGMFGLAWGGLLGRGLGQGDPNLTPFSYSDMISASLGEEIGLTGLMAVIVVYGIIVERGLRVALVCRDAFGKLLATGLAITFALQIFVVIGGATRLIPLTGLTTPFMAYGGSSIVVNWAMIALLLRISDQSRRPAPAVTPLDEDDATQVVKLK
ncbi:FtsW/RodA/SpoVE family cell cycle protein [Nocardioidaceae bacterium SCSIO 66511]|nr:FtsW/RodA/SpoVE family cell cycle protein [Nocardioidaceae bacterium SCSIO 66511]